VSDGPGGFNIKFRVPYDVEACGKLGSPFFSLPGHNDGQHEVDAAAPYGSLLDSSKNLEPKCCIFFVCLAEGVGKEFIRKKGGENQT
jgi:hypothetical protein